MRANDRPTVPDTPKWLLYHEKLADFRIAQDANDLENKKKFAIEAIEIAKTLRRSDGSKINIGRVKKRLGIENKQDKT